MIASSDSEISYPISQPLAHIFSQSTYLDDFKPARTITRRLAVGDEGDLQKQV
jgi:hypothetical protein